MVALPTDRAHYKLLLQLCQHAAKHIAMPQKAQLYRLKIGFLRNKKAFGFE
ncbi:hypothetical protein [Gardnerella leopoldii]|uniref:hypothetical protein n=1 Tax=Gardnerella leopoldii TaxID=2792978 RepID=UPI0013AF98D3|nr:hypothetical protein [Gardnerella leopoldii]